MNMAPMARRAVILSALSLSASPMASAQGVINGDFATPQPAHRSPWYQFYPSGNSESTGNPGVQMRDGRLYLEPRLRAGATDECSPKADIAVFQQAVVPVGTDESKQLVELEFSLRMTPQPGIGCEEHAFEFNSDSAVPAVQACVLEGTTSSAPNTYRQLGDELTVATSDADGGWRRYRATWRRNLTGADVRYMVTIRLADLGESLFLRYDEPTDTVVYHLQNQVSAEIDNVQLTARSEGEDACRLLDGGPSLDVINVASPARRPVAGGAFSGSGPDARCQCASTPCAGDIDGDGAVGGSDLGLLIGAWGTTECRADINGDGTVNGQDIGLLIGAWGICGNSQPG